jgi:hypothetical protein
MMMRDGARDMPRFTDADYALHRPGYRGSDHGTSSSFGDYLLRDERPSAYLDYIHDLETAYLRPRTDAAGDDLEDDAAEVAVSGDNAMIHGAIRNDDNDKRSIGQRMRDHQRHMQSVYNSYAEEISQAWKGK